MSISTDQESVDLQLVPGDATGNVLHLEDGLSFWGGVDPESGVIIDAHHPDRGTSVSGRILMMPTSRGSCSGSGVLLELALNDRAPAALIFCEDEEILTLGALVADKIFGCNVPVLRLSGDRYKVFASAKSATLVEGRLQAAEIEVELKTAVGDDLRLTERDKHILARGEGEAAALAMEIIVQMAAIQGALSLLDVTRGHIDGCILAHSANLIFAERLMEMGARVRIPTTINAISVDRRNWKNQGVKTGFGDRASRLADAYVKMGARATFTCAPYVLGNEPKKGECLGWSESNAVIFANSVLGSRTTKHPDYFDLFVAMTGRAPAVGVYCDEGRRPERIIYVDMPANVDESFWPLLGWLAGKSSPDRVPLIAGLQEASPNRDDLKAFSAAFGSTSGAPMFHIAGHTPEADREPAPDASVVNLGRNDLAAAWQELNGDQTRIDLVAIGSPHVSLTELRRLAETIDGRTVHADTSVIVTVGRGVLKEARRTGFVVDLETTGVKIYPDICWCSITEPVFPENARTLMTNSGKYAHYATGLTGRSVRFGNIDACVEAAVSGRASTRMPDWLTGEAI